MGFSLNPITLIKQEVLKLGAKKGQIPPVITALEKLEKGVERIGVLFAKITPADIDLIVSYIPAPLRALILTKVPASDLLELKEGIIALPAVLTEVDVFLKEAEKELQE